ncbi:hypothetical protein RI129_008478 [Pyrocoelia pectoralis]|uniref:C2H2-type domain-containing protein n=1 Tax=Pyrocoelia pectoralis TaxID=417401 RepID=A0AAN7VB62_9COLE
MATKIFPTSEELSRVDTQIPCTEEGCEQIFKSRANLQLHLVKTHRQPWVTDTSLKEYYCPDIECIFNSEKCFKTLKLLKQHYLKVHGEKRFLCDICNKGFPTLSARNRHVKYCGINFQCCDCNVAYPAYESLMTHGKRKKHKILEKVAYSPTVVQSLGKIQLQHDSTKKESFIVPKGSTSLPLIIIPINLNPTMEKSSQTDLRVSSPNLKTKQTQVVNKRTSQECQTLHLRRTRSSVETQTIGDFIAKKPKLSTSDCSISGKKTTDNDTEQKSIETQTKSPTFNSQASNTSFELSLNSFELSNDDFIMTPIVHKSDSGTQTTVDSLYSISTATHDSIHTDTSDLNFEFMHSSSQTCFNEDMSAFISSNYFNCNMETQTDFLFDNVLLNYDASSESVNCSFDDDLENYCHDIMLNTIHTQTMFDDVARSVESQTVMSRSNIKNTVGKDMANTETQTDTNFQKLLEEINA